MVGIVPVTVVVFFRFLLLYFSCGVVLVQVFVSLWLYALDCCVCITLGITVYVLCVDNIQQFI